MQVLASMCLSYPFSQYTDQPPVLHFTSRFLPRYAFRTNFAPVTVVVIITAATTNVAIITTTIIVFIGAIFVGAFCVINLFSAFSFPFRVCENSTAADASNKNDAHVTKIDYCPF